MAESTIITGQFVRISQTPASIGERLIALAIDYFLLWPCFHGFIYPLISRCFSFLPLSTYQSCFMHFSAKCSTRDKVSASG